MSRKQQPKKAGTTRKPPTESAGEVLDLKAAADFLKVSKPTFYRWLAQGKIKGHKVGQQWRFYRTDLENFLRAEEPSALQVDSDTLRAAVEKARRARKLPPIQWPEAETPEESTVIGAVNALITDAIEAKASDIHMDNNADETLVRYRIDGVLHEAMTLPREASRPIVSRLKLMGDMNINERRLPQNGRISMRLGDEEHDVRVTTMPAVFGESAILRILSRSSILIGLEKLGFSKPMHEAFERVLRNPNGMVIVTGPSGSGRTTTLYSALNLINSSRVKIVSIEDPVEYFIPNTMQVHVNRKAGLTMAIALRTFVRCDPDIIVVGELRDMETVQSCASAAMTGHLVLTAALPLTAPAVVTRLIEVGLEPFIVSASVTAVLAQRLVRRVCPECTVADKVSPGLVRSLEARTGLDLSRATFQRGKGCPKCRGYGYRGRTAIFELMEVDQSLRELIITSPTTDDLRAAAIDAGMAPMLTDGIEKAAQGVTTVEEVLRVLAGQQMEEAKVGQ